MPVHQLGGRDIEVSPRSVNLFFYRSQGVSIKVSPQRKWYCLWLCSSTTTVDAISGTVNLSGLAAPASGSASCRRCGDLNVMGPNFWGVNVPQPYQRAQYEGVVRIGGTDHGFTGTVLF